MRLLGNGLDERIKFIESGDDSLLLDEASELAVVQSEHLCDSCRKHDLET